MKRVTSLVLALALSLPLLADGTVTAPTNIAPASFKIASLHVTTGVGSDLASGHITIYYFDAGSAVVQTANVTLSQAEVIGFMSALMTSVAGEPAGGTNAAIYKRFRMRATKWLTDNGKLTNVTPE